MQRRALMERLIILGAAGLIPGRLLAHRDDVSPITPDIQKWYEQLSLEQYSILVMGDTEMPGSSELLYEKRAGVYRCLGCGLELFRSEWKYDSRTGWPSFWDVIPDHVNENRFGLGLIGTIEYKCARCGGHHGHIFDDGPEPTGRRYCNNGAVLEFVPDESG